MVSFVSNYNAVSVGSSATLIMASNPSRKGSMIFNNSAGTVFLGMDSSVTTTTGIPVVQNSTFNNSGIQDAWRGDIYGIVVSGSSDIRFWEWGP
jgi:hypothetical protein